MYESGIVNGKPIHMYIGDKVKPDKEKPCEHGWVKSEREPFCHYCEGCCF